MKMKLELKLSWFMLVFMYLRLDKALGAHKFVPKIDQHPISVIVNASDPVTLECSASGEPKPKITWYKDGVQLNLERNSNSDLANALESVSAFAASVQPSTKKNKYALIHDSSLFIFSATLGKGNRSDNGVYSCKAENELGYVFSNNATLVITYLKDDFRETPKSRQVNAGIRVAMDCRAPRGQPDPTLSWEKNGVKLNIKSNSVDNYARSDKPYEFFQNGTLLILNSSINDNGEYVCVAKNEAGEKRSAPALLNVFEKPSFLIKPENSKYELNTRAEFKCQADGFPKPQIEWKKDDSVDNIPSKALIRDNLLIIPYVQLEDEGEYHCVATNQLASIETKAVLTVNEKPKFVKTMSNVTVGIESKSIIIECNARGKPQPVIYWAKSSQNPKRTSNSFNSYETNTSEMSEATTSQDDFIILENGNLFIERLSKKYEGTYLCQASNEYGNIETKTYLKVKPLQTKPPPIIVYGPQNQTIPINTQATLECLTSTGTSLIYKDSQKTNHHRSKEYQHYNYPFGSNFNEKITITWLKGTQDLISNSNFDSIKYKIQESGSLEINSVQKTDSGVYKCVATNIYGQTVSMISYLNVENPNNQFVEFQRNHETTTLPSAPTQPIISSVSSTSLILTWQASAHSGHSQLKGYTIEYFSPEWQSNSGWSILAENIPPVSSYFVENLLPDTYYMFIVRARNEQGYGPPSQVSDLIKTTVETQSFFRNKDSNDLLEKALTGEIIQLNEMPDVLSSTSINITWKIYKSAFLIEGFSIKYKPIGSKEYQVETLLENRHNYFVLKNLNKFTSYEILVEPFAGPIRGSESNVVQAKTKEDVPSQSPINLQVEVESVNSLAIKWQPPPNNHMNGIILGYKINCLANETKYNINLNTNSTSRAIMLGNLIAGMKYCVRVAAYTKIGIGPYTVPKCNEMTDASLVKSKIDTKLFDKVTIVDHIKLYMRQPWFISMFTVICLISICLIFYCLWYSLKRIFLREKHTKYLSSNNGSLSLPHKIDNGNRYKLVNDTIWLDTLYSSNHSNQDCCCVPDLQHQLFLQNNGNVQILHDLHNNQLSTMDKRNLHNLSINSKNHNQLLRNHHSCSNSSQSANTNMTNTAPQYAEIYASSIQQLQQQQQLSANPYATTGLFSCESENTYNTCDDDQTNNNNNTSNSFTVFNHNQVGSPIINNQRGNVKYSSYTLKLIDEHKLNSNGGKLKANEIDLNKIANIASMPLSEQKKILKYLQATQSQTNTPKVQLKNLQNRVKSVDNQQNETSPNCPNTHNEEWNINNNNINPIILTTLPHFKDKLAVLQLQSQANPSDTTNSMHQSFIQSSSSASSSSNQTQGQVPSPPSVPPPSLPPNLFAHQQHLTENELTNNGNQSPVHYNSPWNMNMNSNDSNLNSILLTRLASHQNNQACKNNSNHLINYSNNPLNISRLYQINNNCIGVLNNMNNNHTLSSTFTSQQYANRILNNKNNMLSLEIQQQKQQAIQQPDYLSLSPNDQEANSYFGPNFIQTNNQNQIKLKYLTQNNHTNTNVNLTKPIYFNANDQIQDSMYTADAKVINQISSSYDSTNQNTYSSSDSSILSSSKHSSNKSNNDLQVYNHLNENLHQEALLNKNLNEIAS